MTSLTEVATEETFLESLWSTHVCVSLYGVGSDQSSGVGVGGSCVAQSDIRAFTPAAGTESSFIHTVTVT